MPQRDLACLQLAPQHLHLLQTLLQKYVPNAEIWAFGSRVDGRAHEGSDLDLVLRNTNDLTQSVKGSFELREALAASLLPILIDIHDWAHIPVAFHHNIERGYVVLQGLRHPTTHPER